MTLHSDHAIAASKPVRNAFGNDCRWRESFGFPERQCRTLAALVAAEVTQMAPCTLLDLAEIGAATSHSEFAALERSLWVEHVGTCCETRRKLWRATARARRELGLVGWTFTNGSANG